jgi:hypothetical protein
MPSSKIHLVNLTQKIKKKKKQIGRKRSKNASKKLNVYPRWNSEMAPLQSSVRYYLLFQ